MKLWDKMAHFINEAGSFTELLFKVLVAMGDEERKLFAWVIWSLWRHRNQRLWEEKDVSID